MDENLTDRAKVYWDTLEEGELINAEEMFTASRRTQDLGEDIRFVRSFLDGEVNQGRGILVAGQSPPTYRKHTQWNSITDVCTRRYMKGVARNKLSYARHFHPVWIAQHVFVVNAVVVLVVE